MNIFPKFIQSLPEADIPLEGCRAWLSENKTHQILFMIYEKDVIFPEHSHEAQAGFVIEGKIEMVINDEKFTFKKGDRYSIEAGVKHSAKIFAGYADITYFNQPGRYKTRGNNL